MITTPYPPIIDALTLEGCEATPDINKRWWAFPCGLALDKDLVRADFDERWRDLLYAAHRKHHDEGHMKGQNGDAIWGLTGSIKGDAPDRVRCDCPYQPDVYVMHGKMGE